MFGPLTYTNHLDMVMSRMDELLIPNGIVKACMLLRTFALIDKAQMDRRYAERAREVEAFFRQRGYGFAFTDKDYYSREYGKGTDRIFLVVKPGTKEENLDAVAQMVIDEDSKTMKVMETNLSTPQQHAKG